MSQWLLHGNETQKLKKGKKKVLNISLLQVIIFVNSVVIFVFIISVHVSQLFARYINFLFGLFRKLSWRRVFCFGSNASEQ